MSRILIVEDEKRIALLLERGLQASGYTTSVAAGGRDALALARTEQFDLVVLDLGLPDVDGAEVLRQLRESGAEMPVIVLTARTGVTDTVAALEGGADDYVTKPFRFEELLARIRVRLRGDRAGEETMLIRVGDSVLDVLTRRMHIGGREVELTAREFAVAEVFFRHPGQVLSRGELLRLAWGTEDDSRSNLVEVYVRYLRRKMGEDRIATVRGMGYRLVEVTAPPATGRRLLLIDDDQVIADLVRGLASLGWEVTVAENSGLGLYRAITEDFDVVLLDISSPGVSGMSVIEQLSAERPDVPVVVLTARHEERARRAAGAAGAAAFETKPCEVEGLAETLSRVVAARGHRD